MRFLITGCGGDVAQSIAGALRDAYPDVWLLGCDIHSDHAGQCVFDCVHVVPRPGSDDYRQVLGKLVTDHQIGFLIPTSEPELREIALGPPVEFDGCGVIHPSASAIAIGLDKLKTAEFLEAAGLPFPWTVPVAEGDPLATPCILKQRHGCGSKAMFVVEAESVGYYRKRYPQAIWQQMVGDEHCEYTCGLFRSRSGMTRSISIRRRLVGGVTGSGVVESVDAIDGLLHSIAESLDLWGSINVQLRFAGDRPLVFEINPRFSSTTLFRHLLGFTDVVWSIEDTMGRTLGEYRPPLDGTRIYRGAREFVISP